jgi:Ca2+-binding RTX toxin-like protein
MPLINFPTINGTNGGDSLYGTDIRDRIHGNGGNDSLKGFGGNDHLDGGAGIDAAFYGDSTVGVSVDLAQGRGLGGSAEGDTLVNVENLYGSYYGDTFTGNDGANALHGLEGNDVLKGAGGDDRLIGSIGDDFLKGGGGGDYLEGGDGIDTVDYSNATTHVVVDLRRSPGIGGISNGDSNGDSFVGVENATGSDFDDNLIGTDGANFLRGMVGNDWLRGSGGDDRLEGGTGNDLLDGEIGADTMIGGLDDDYYRVENVGDVVVENAGEGRDGVQSDISYTLGANLENLFLRVGPSNGTGNALDNYIGGSSGDNILDGGLGVDIMAGSLGNDTYYVDNAGDSVRESAGQGSDAVRTTVSYVLAYGQDVEYLATMSHSGTQAINLTGNATGNIVQGNDGANQIAGGDGRDELTGGGGQDRFLFNSPPNAATNMDVITDFNVADDTIVLENAVFAGLADGPLAADRFRVGTAALDANDNVIYNAGNGALFYDADGNGAGPAVQFAQLTAGLALTANDFLIV